MGDSQERAGSRDPALDETEIERLPSPPDGVSRVDTLPDDFVKSVSRRPHLLGDVIAGRYRLVETLGDGAMGQVFVAENLAIGKRVAIKVLKPELLSDKSFRQRFQHEAMAIAAIDHRNVARFLDLIVGDPTFLVMEYVEGPTLGKVLKRQTRFPVARAVDIAVRLAWALEAAHHAGVIHRDVKPANVILAGDPELGEEPKLIDFGLAKLPTAIGAEDLTRTGQIVGTPQYMSPEQISNKNIDARSDVYALGCLIYHLLAGAPPFFGGDDVQILYRQIEETPRPLSELDASIPPAVDAVVRRALAKRPEERYATMRELAVALDAARPDRRAAAPARVAAGERWYRARIPWGLALAAPLALLLAVAVYSIARGSSSHAPVVFVTTDPAGASIELDGKRLAAKTPHGLVRLASGQHVVRLSLAGRDPIERFLSLDGRGDDVEIRATFSPASHPVEITSVPDGAFVFLDGRLAIGQTPLSVTVTDDDFHELRVERPGFVTERRRLTPDDRQPALSFELATETEPVGTLWIEADRAGRVFIDGSDSGFLTPTVGIRLAAGPHTIELRDAAGHVHATETLQLHQGETMHPMLKWRDEP